MYINKNFKVYFNLFKQQKFKSTKNTSYGIQEKNQKCPQCIFV